MWDAGRKLPTATTRRPIATLLRRRLDYRRYARPCSFSTRGDKPMKFAAVRTLATLALLLTQAGCTGDRLRQSAAPLHMSTVV